MDLDLNDTAIDAELRRRLTDIALAMMHDLPEHAAYFLHLVAVNRRNRRLAPVGRFPLESCHATRTTQRITEDRRPQEGHQE